MSRYLFDDEKQKKLKGVYWQGIQKEQTKLKEFNDNMAGEKPIKDTENPIGGESPMDVENPISLSDIEERLEEDPGISSARCREGEKGDFTWCETEGGYELVELDTFNDVKESAGAEEVSLQAKGQNKLLINFLWSYES